MQRSNSGLFWPVLVLVTTVDFCTKALAVSRLTLEHMPHDLFGDWVRFTLVPGLTDDPANVDKVARFVAPMKNVQWVEVQPFHQLGAFKWKAMNLDYEHAGTSAPAPDLVKRVIEQFRAAGCRAR